MHNACSSGESSGRAFDSTDVLRISVGYQHREIIIKASNMHRAAPREQISIVLQLYYKYQLLKGGSWAGKALKSGTGPHLLIINPQNRYLFEKAKIICIDAFPGGVLTTRGSLEYYPLQKDVLPRRPQPLASLVGRRKEYLPSHPRHGCTSHPRSKY